MGDNLICYAHPRNKNNAYRVLLVEDDATFGDFNRNRSMDSNINSALPDAMDSHRILQEVSHA